MLRRISSLALVAVALSLSLAQTSQAAALRDPALSAKLAAASTAELVSVIVTYDSKPIATDLAALRGLGIRYGVALKELPMVGVWATSAQINSLANAANVHSIYLNKPLAYFNYEGSALIGASEQRSMPGFGYTGRGVGVAIVDSGVDATHPDLPYGSHVKQNAKVIVGGAGLGSPFEGVVPPLYLENLPDSDTTSGHGTHAAGSIAGLGTQSGGKYAGVAPGVDLIGISTGEAIAVLWALEGFDYVLTHQSTYNIKVVSNSWGTSGPFDPEDPVSVASKKLHDRGITVVFAAGNEGSGNNTLNPYSVAPWVIGVAAGDKKGVLAGFSSRGIPNDARYHPTITAPGVAIVSVKANATPLGQAGQCSGLTVAETPWYACMDGTSMATPHVAGACALLLEANSTLTPDQIKKTIEDTATPMAGYARHQDGAGFLNVLAGLDAVKNTQKSYGAVLNRTYNASFTGSTTTELWSQPWAPNGEAHWAFNVGQNGIESDVFMTWDNPANTFNLAVTDPNGTVTSTGSNLLAAVYGLQDSLSFNGPVAGTWFITGYGLKGQSTGTSGVGVPDTLHGTIMNYYGTFSGLDDVSSSPFSSYIRRAVTLRLMDSVTANTFTPSAKVTRGEVAQTIAADCFVRQTLINNVSFTDVSASLAPYVGAVTTAGGPLRDTFMASRSIMSGTSASTFDPNGTVSRADLAVWLVRALGKEADAQAAMSTATTFTDDASIPASARGYVVVASNTGLMPGFVNSSPIPGAPVTYSWQPATDVTRDMMAFTIDKWYDVFMTP